MIFVAILFALTSLTLAVMFNDERHRRIMWSKHAAHAQKMAFELGQELSETNEVFNRAIKSAVEQGHEIARLIVARDDAMEALRYFQNRNPNWN